MGVLESLINIRSLLFGVGALVAVYCYNKIYFFVKLRRFKGPWLSRFSEIPHARALFSEECHNWYTEVSNRYGRIAVVSPRILATSSPELWARSNSHPGYTRSKWFYRPLRYDWRIDNVFSQVDDKKHDARRKQMIQGYSGKENLTLEGDIDGCTSQLIQLIRTRYATAPSPHGIQAAQANKGKGGRPMDLAQKVQFLTLDIISTIGFGRCFGLLSGDADPDGYLLANEAGLHRANTQLALGTWWTNWLPLLGPRFDANLATAKGFDKMIALSAEMVEGRERAFRKTKMKKGDDNGVMVADEVGEGEEEKEKADMLTSFLKHGLAGEDLKSEVVLQIVAGSDTTAGAIRGTMLYLLANPRVYKALQSEIDEAVRSGRAAAPDGDEESKGAATAVGSGVISYAQARQLPYLQAVIREGLRIFPPVTDPLGRDTPPEGDTVTFDNGEEVSLPGGVSVIPSFVAMQRDRDVFGEDADVFRPERWIDEPDPARLEAMRRVCDLDFGHSRYLCLGKNIAMMELSKVVFELLRHFEWGLVNPEKPWKNVNYTGLRSISDLWVQVEERVVVA